MEVFSTVYDSETSGEEKIRKAITEVKDRWYKRGLDSGLLLYPFIVDLLSDVNNEIKYTPDIDDEDLMKYFTSRPEQIIKRTRFKDICNDLILLDKERKFSYSVKERLDFLIEYYL